MTGRDSGRAPAASNRAPGRGSYPRVHALLQALLIHRLLPHGFTNRELRALIAAPARHHHRGHHRRADEAMTCGACAPTG